MTPPCIHPPIYPSNQIKLRHHLHLNFFDIVITRWEAFKFIFWKLQYTYNLGMDRYDCVSSQRITLKVVSTTRTHVYSWCIDAAMLISKLYTYSFLLLCRRRNQFLNYQVGGNTSYKGMGYFGNSCGNQENDIIINPFWTACAYLWACGMPISKLGLHSFMLCKDQRSLHVEDCQISLLRAI